MADISGFAEHLGQNISKFSPLSPRHCGCSLEVRLTKFPVDTVLLDFTGYDPMTYMSTLSALEKDHMLGKIVILDAAQNLEANGEQSKISPYHLPRLSVEGLFLSEKLARTPKKLAPLSTAGPYSSVTSNGGLISPQSPARTHGRPIDLSLVSHRLI